MKYILFMIAFLPSAFAGSGAHYEVPVPAELKAYSQFPLESFKMEREGNSLVVTYVLPLEITGVPNHVRFEGEIGADGVARLEGRHDSSLTCRKLDLAENECAAKYHGVVQNLVAVEALLDARGVTGSEKAARLAVAKHVVTNRSFPRAIAALREGGDMEGFVYYQGDYPNP